MVTVPELADSIWANLKKHIPEVSHKAAAWIIISEFKRNGCKTMEESDVWDVVYIYDRAKCKFVKRK